MKISVIIPTYNEAKNIASLIRFLKSQPGDHLADIIVSDGGSTDDTLRIATGEGATAMLSPGKGRAAQMNYGASLANGDILYFIHADCRPPENFINDIIGSVKQGFDLGRYRTRFDSPKLLLKLNAWITRYDFFICMGGDQTIFIKKDVFESHGGFNEQMRIMEEYEFCTRVRKSSRYRIMPKAVMVSARKYDTNSWLRVQLANAKVVKLFRRGASQQEMLETYRRMLEYRKNAF